MRFTFFSDLEQKIKEKGEEKQVVLDSFMVLLFIKS